MTKEHRRLWNAVKRLRTAHANANYTSSRTTASSYKRIADARSSLFAVLDEQDLWGAYHNGTLCCRGTEEEIKNKIANERRGPHRRGWEAKRLKLL